MSRGGFSFVKVLGLLLLLCFNFLCKEFKISRVIFSRNLGGRGGEPGRHLLRLPLRFQDTPKYQPQFGSFSFLCGASALTPLPNSVRHQIFLPSRQQRSHPKVSVEPGKVFMSKLSHQSTAERRYSPYRKFPALFGDKFETSWLDPKFLELLLAIPHQTTLNPPPNKDQPKDSSNSPSANPSSLLPHLLEESDGVYSFPCLSAEFLGMFMKELQHFYTISAAEDIPVRRPNSMNNYGVIVNDIGMRPMITAFQQQFLWPLAKYLFPIQGEQFDDHHSFLVRYQADEDLGLDMHIDDSDVTFNVCLGDSNFTGATLVFCGTFGESNHRKVSHTYHHQVGRAVLHLGSRRHGADDIASGTRTNLIVWSHNWKYRSSPEYRNRQRAQVYEKEEGPPDQVCLSYTHDRDYQHFLPLTQKKAQENRHAWCPPPGKEYDGYGKEINSDVTSKEENTTTRLTPKSQDDL